MADAKVAGAGAWAGGAVGGGNPGAGPPNPPAADAPPGGAPKKDAALPSLSALLPLPPPKRSAAGARGSGAEGAGFAVKSLLGAAPKKDDASARDSGGAEKSARAVALGTGELKPAVSGEPKRFGGGADASPGFRLKITLAAGAELADAAAGGCENAPSSPPGAGSPNMLDAACARQSRISRENIRFSSAEPCSAGAMEPWLSRGATQSALHYKRFRIQQTCLEKGVLRWLGCG